LSTPYHVRKARFGLVTMCIGVGQGIALIVEARLMAAYERVLVEIAGGIGTLTLNRPEKLNAFDTDACSDLIEALRMLAGSDPRPGDRADGAGRAFCAGADLSVLGTDGPALVAAGKDIALLIRSAPKPVLAAVNGPAAGGGRRTSRSPATTAFASDQASIGQVFHKLGLSLDWAGSYFLPRVVGISKAWS